MVVLARTQSRAHSVLSKQVYFLIAKGEGDSSMTNQSFGSLLVLFKTFLDNFDGT